MNELTDGGYEMLRAAVNAARQFQCQSVKVLKDRLLLTFPGREGEINEAITTHDLVCAAVLCAGGMLVMAAEMASVSRSRIIGIDTTAVE